MYAAQGSELGSPSHPFPRALLFPLGTNMAGQGENPPSEAVGCTTAGEWRRHTGGKVDRSCGFAKEFRFFSAVEYSVAASAIMNRLRWRGPGKQDVSEQGQMGLRISRGLGPLTLLWSPLYAKGLTQGPDGGHFGSFGILAVGNVEVSGS